ncbi:MAG: tRNA epoxyqueuosine(34) reductase QueG [Verrucomicrobia bacterium]|nr:MAG: tRNA epoxyqueuosine(34) reductase QueG [Verrucomicrobiota bacterium]
MRRRALELGFDACRFTTAEPPSSASQFQQWLASHRHGEMEYLQRNARKRIDPQQVLPGARSVLCLAASYTVPSSEFRVPSLSRSETRNPKPETSNGVVARYARYHDYHDVLGPRLKQLTGFVNRLGGAGTRSLWYVDTGPLLERDLAQRAGLGFVGKHTNLISRELGNWIFLAEIITTLELEPDLPEKNRCGTCARCIDACPTHAITGPFQLDARLCISYLTIELKGPIPVELRPAIGNRIYGCDDCLAACPWNRFAREGKLMKEHGRRDLEQPDLIELLSLDEAGFKRKFAGTPILRTKRRGLLRNVCVALGNIGDTTDLPALQRAARDPEPLIVEHARWAIDRIQKKSGAKEGKD